MMHGQTKIKLNMYLAQAVLFCILQIISPVEVTY